MKSVLLILALVVVLLVTMGATVYLQFLAPCDVYPSWYTQVPARCLELRR